LQAQEIYWIIPNLDSLALWLEEEKKSTLIFIRGLELRLNRFKK
jgi:hypothetical protein